MDSGKPKSNNVIRQNVTAPPPSTISTLTKEELEDNARLNFLKGGQQDIKDCPTLENDEYYIEWHKKVDQQSKLDK